MGKNEKKNAWLKYDSHAKNEIFEFCEGYKNYLSVAKTERECIHEAIRLAEEKGYKNLNDLIKNNETLKPGDKVYANNKDKTLALYLIGKDSIENGMRIIGSHVDSPRLDLKQNPLYEDSDLALMDTHYYGGVKKYQWVALPLALHGIVVKKDGTKINVVIGEDDNDPVLGISDLLIHLSANQLQKKANEVIAGEDLNVLVGNMPLEGAEKNAVKENILLLLKDKYDFEEEDFISAEFEIVPAGKARDLGLDKSMVIGYGQDDRVCCYASLRAIIDTANPRKTAMCVITDKEEVGFNGVTGMETRVFDS